MFFRKAVKLLICLSFNVLAQNKEPVWVEIILDASGSMSNDIKNQPKIVAAKKMLSAFVKSIEDEGARVALRTFGHRRSRDCNDIELKLDYYPKDLNKIQKIISEINPAHLGMTPLAKSMELAHNNLSSKNGKKNLIVITDGNDTCKGDPCKVAEKLKKELNVKVYLVAYGVTDPKKFKELQCVGEPIEPQAPNSPTALGENLAKIKKEIQGTSQTILVRGPDPLAWAIAENLKNPSQKIRFISSQGIPLEPGEYRVTVEYDKPFIFNRVELKKNQTRVLTVSGEARIAVGFLHPTMKVVAFHNESSRKIEINDKDGISIPTGSYTVAAQSHGGLVYQWPPQIIAPGSFIRLPAPPWGVLTYRGPENIPFRVYSTQVETVDRDFFKTDSTKPANSPPQSTVDPEKIVAERQPIATGISNNEILLEQGKYLVITNDGQVFENVMIKKEKMTVVPPEN